MRISDWSSDVCSSDLFRAKAFVLPDDRTLVDEVDEALEVAFGADGQIEDSRGRAEAIDDRLDAIIEIGAGAVELVDEAHPRNLVLVRLTPHGFRLRLDAGNAVERGDRAVKDAQADRKSTRLNSSH